MSFDNSSSSQNPFSSPNAIPPRTSSTGSHSRGPSTSLPSPPARNILRPLAEGDWLSQKGASPPTDPFLPASFPFNMSNQGDTGYPQPNGHHAFAMERYATDDLDFTAKKTWSSTKEGIIRGPFDYVISHQGKNFRTQLIASFNAWLDVPKESLEIITKVVGMLHESSLLIDDVQDGSELRRGFPVAHSIFGVAQTINSANYIYFAALEEIQKLNNPETISIFSRELLYLHRGQGMDLFWRDSLVCPSEEDYLEMVGNKTGGLFRLGIKLMQAESRSDIDCVALVNLMGLIFQIRDDYMNLHSKEYTTNKGMYEDLTEGKFSFPVIHCIRSDPSNLQLINILKQKTSDLTMKHYAVALMERSGSFDYTRQVVTTLIERARKAAEQVDAGRGLAQGIHKILDKMII